MGTASAGQASAPERDRDCRERALAAWGISTPAGVVAYCALCPAGTPPYPERRVEVDHKVALANWPGGRPGANDLNNLWILCEVHHREKTRSDMAKKKLTMEVTADTTTKTVRAARGSSMSMTDFATRAVGVLFALALAAMGILWAVHGLHKGTQTRTTTDHASHTAGHVAAHVGSMVLTAVIVLLAVLVPLALLVVAARLFSHARTGVVERTYRVVAGAAKLGLQPDAEPTIWRRRRRWRHPASLTLDEFWFSYPHELDDTDPRLWAAVADGLGRKLGDRWTVTPYPVKDRARCRRVLEDPADTAVDLAKAADNGAPPGLSPAEVRQRQDDAYQRMLAKVELALPRARRKGDDDVLNLAVTDWTEGHQPAAFTLVYGKGVAFTSDEARREFHDAIANAFPYQRWITEWDTGADRVVFHQQPAVAGKIPHPGPERGRPWYQIRVGPVVGTNKIKALNLKIRPHVLICGESGAGKTSVCRAVFQDILDSAAELATNMRVIAGKEIPGALVWFLDPKKIEFHWYEDHPAVHRYASSNYDMFYALLNLKEHMDWRYEVIKRGVDPGSLPKLFIIADELHRLHDRMAAVWAAIQASDKKYAKRANPALEALAELAELARSAGIHLVFATQRADAKWFGGSNRDMFNNRIQVGAATSEAAARMMFGASDIGRDLPGVQGRCTVQTDEGDGASRRQLTEEVQAFWVPNPANPEEGEDVELLKRLFSGYERPVAVDIADLADTVPEPAYTEDLDKLLGFGVAAGGDEWPEDDGERPAAAAPRRRGAVKPSAGDDTELLPEAAALVISTQFGSTSMIQRKLRVGFAKAGRLMDALEAAGVVGPAEGSRARQVLVPVDDEQRVVAELRGEPVVDTGEAALT